LINFQSFYEYIVEKKQKGDASTNKENIAGLAGGIGATYGINKAAKKAVTKSRGTKGKIARTALHGDRKVWDTVMNNPFSKAGRKRASNKGRVLKNAFKKSPGKTLGKIGIGLAVTSLIWTLGEAVTKNIVKKLQKAQKVEIDLKKKLKDPMTTPEDKKAIKKRLETMSKNKKRLKERVDRKVELEKKKLAKLTPEERAYKKKQAAQSAQKLEKQLG
jgi:hypothetical protein